MVNYSKAEVKCVIKSIMGSGWKKERSRENEGRHYIYIYIYFFFFKIK